MRLVYENYMAIYADKIRTAFSAKGKERMLKTLLKGVECYNQNRLDKALKIFKKLLERCETRDEFAAVLLFIAKVYEDMGYSELALQTYKQLLDHDGENSTAWSNMGLVYEERGDSAEAISCYEKSIACNPKNPYPHNNVAAVYYRTGNYEEAIVSAKRALELKRNLYQASNTLCLTYMAMGNRAESEKYYKLSIANGADVQGLSEAVRNVNISVAHSDGLFD